MPTEPEHNPENAAGGADRLSPLRELQLVEAHRRGDPAAMGALLHAYQRRIYSICYRMLRDPHDARDVTQDVMVKILQGIGSYDGRSRLSTWIYRVAVNCCLSHLRRRRVRRHGSLSAGDGDAGPSALSPSGAAAGELRPPGSVQQAELREILEACLAGLDGDMRAVLVLRDCQDLEYHRIAEVLEIPVGTVKSRLFRARLALREALESRLGRPPAGDESITEAEAG